MAAATIMETPMSRRSDGQAVMLKKHTDEVERLGKRAEQGKEGFNEGSDGAPSNGGGKKKEDEKI